MKLFCREDHSVVPPRDLKQELLEARARLARYELLPASSFTRYPDFNRTYMVQHGIDEKPKAIARVKADIAELEVLSGEKS
jgi:hypothetical protein